MPQNSQKHREIVQKGVKFSSLPEDTGSPIKTLGDAIFF